MAQIQVFPNKFSAANELLEMARKKLYDAFREVIEVGQIQNIFRRDLEIPLFTAVVFGSLQQIIRMSTET